LGREWRKKERCLELFIRVYMEKEVRRRRRERKRKRERERWVSFETK